MLRSLVALAALFAATPALHAQSPGAPTLPGAGRGGFEFDEAMLIGSDTDDADEFGGAVAVFGDVAIVGAIRNEGGGAAYVFTFDGTEWTQQARLTSGDGDSGWFGYSVALGDGVAVVGDPLDGTAQDGTGTRGAAYVFTFDGTQWTQRFKLQDAQAATGGERFGNAVALDGALVLVGDYIENRHSSGPEGHYGAAYLFDVETGTQVARLAPSVRAPGFGYSVALRGGRALVGAFSPFGENIPGQAFVYSGPGWTQQVAFSPTPDNDPAHTFGASVALSDEFAFVAKYGAVSVYDVATWTQRAALQAANVGGRWGYSLAADGPRLLVGDDIDDGRGAAYLYGLDGATWTELGRYTASDRANGERFGAAVALSGPRALVGAPSHGGSTVRAGAAYVLTRPEGRLTVTVTGDEPNDPVSQDEDVCDVDRSADGEQCTLRAAIEVANAADEDEAEVGIAFEIEGEGPHTIALESPLPTLDRRMKLDGATEPDFEAGTATAAPRPSVHVVGGGSVPRGLVLAGDSVTVIGLAFAGFSEAAIDVPPEGRHHVVEACWLGLDASGTAALANGVGVRVRAPDVVIGSESEAGRNVIAGNTTAGVQVAGEGATGVRVVGNWVGVKADGEAALPNALGVDVLGAPGLVVEGNTILASTAGVRLTGLDGQPTTGVHVVGNRLGLLPNNALPPGPPAGYGVFVENAEGTVVGGAAETPGDAPGNVIGGWIAGVLVAGTATGHPAGTRIAGNLIGLDSTGTAARPNGAGVWVFGGAEDTRVGGWAPGERNVISGNALPNGNGAGVVVTTGDGAGAVGEPTGTVIAGNYVGTDVTGTQDVGNERWGVYVAPLPGGGTDGPSDVVVGATATMAPGASSDLRRNVIAHSGEANVLVDRTGPAADAPVRVVGNWIGLDVNGDGGIDQGTFGGATRVGVHVRGTARAVVGGAGEDGNVVSGHRIGVWTDADDGVVVGNRVGTDPAGLERRANLIGVAVSGSRVRVGLSRDGAPGPNVISGNILAGESNGSNDGVGVYVATRDLVEAFVTAARPAEDTPAIPDAARPEEPGVRPVGAAALGGGPPAVGNVVAYNLIGTTAAGDAAVVPTAELNHTAAVWVTSGAVDTGVYANTIGGTWNGIQISPPTGSGVTAFPTGTRVAGNRIGLAAAGGDEDFVPNRAYGIGVAGSVGTVIGDGAVEGQGPNRIAGTGAEGSGLPPDNAGAPGVAIRHPADLPEGWPASGPTLRRNLIYANEGLAVTRDAARFAVTPNGPANTDGSASFDFPVLLQAVTDPGGLSVVGTASTSMAVEVYADRPCDASGHGEARVYLGTVQAADGVFGGTVDAPPFSDWRIAVTGTNVNGSTSEFGACVAVAAPGEALIVPIAPGETPDVDGPDVTVTVTDNPPALASRARSATRPGAPSDTPARSAAGTLYVGLHRGAADEGPFAGSATGDDGTEVVPNGVQLQRFWSVRSDGLDGVTYTACLRYDGLYSLPVPGQLVVVTRPARGEAWTPHASTLSSAGGESYLCAAGLTAFGELALGADSAVNPVAGEAGPDAAPEAAAPSAFTVSTFPNPSSGEVAVAVSVPVAGVVRVAVYDALGRRVAVLHDGPLAVGTHALRWDAGALPSGVYVVRAAGETAVQTQRVTVVR